MMDGMMDGMHCGAPHHALPDAGVDVFLADP